IAHFLGARDRAAEDENRQAATVDAADRPDQVETWRTRQPEIEHQEIDVIAIRAHARQQLGRALHRNGAMPGMLERRLKTVPHERGIVGDDDSFRADERRGHLKSYQSPPADTL